MLPAAVPAVSDSTNLDMTLGQLLDSIEKMPTTAVYVAATVGLMLFVIGWFAGIRENKFQMMLSAFIAVVVGFFSLRLPAMVIKLLASFINPQIALLVVYIIWSFFLVGMAIFLYETWIVTLKEQFGKQS